MGISCCMLRCRDGSLYTGWTNDLEGRLRCHNAGRGGKYTRSRLPVELVYCESFETKAEAMIREWHLILIPNKNKTIFAARIVPYGVGLLDHICPLCSSEPALSGAILTRKSLSTFYRVSVSSGCPGRKS